MKIKFWGTRGSIPTPLGSDGVRQKIRNALEKSQGRKLNTSEDIDAFLDGLPVHEVKTWGGDTSCVELPASDGFRVLCDGGTGLRSFGNAILASNAPGERLTFHILLSHFHWDHVMGLPFFVPAYIPGNKIMIHSCHPNAEEAVRHQWGLPGFPVDFAVLGAEFVFEIHKEGVPFEVDGYSVTALKQRHGGDSFGFRFEGRDRVVVYSTDSEHKKDLVNPDYPFVEFFREADLVIFDAQYSLEEAVSVKEDWGHSSNIIGVELAKRAKAKRLCLFHHEPNYDDADLHQILEEAIEYEREFHSYVQQHKVEIVSARDGMVIEI